MILDLYTINYKTCNPQSMMMLNNHGQLALRILNTFQKSKHGNKSTAIAGFLDDPCIESYFITYILLI